MEYRQALGLSLREIRMARGLSQESFVGVSGRTYISEIERGLKGITVEKVIELSELMGVHPLTLLLDSFSRFEEVTTARLLKQIAKEHKTLGGEELEA